MRRAIFALALLSAAALPTHAIAKEAKLSLEQRVERAEAELAIRRIIIDYAAALDGRDAGAYVALFAKNGEWINGNIVRKGPDEIRALVEGLFGKTPPPGFVNHESFELTSNPRIDVDGDHATSHSWHLLFRRGPDGRPVAALAGRYDDEYIREDGKWKILKRVDNPIMPTPEEWMKQMQERKAKQP